MTANSCPRMGACFSTNCTCHPLPSSGAPPATEPTPTCLKCLAEKAKAVISGAVSGSFWYCPKCDVLTVGGGSTFRLPVLAATPPASEPSEVEVTAFAAAFFQSEPATLHLYADWRDGTLQKRIAAALRASRTPAASETPEPTLLSESDAGEMHRAYHASINRAAASETRAPELEPRRLRDGEPCSHRGCASHHSHPCEGCGRLGARGTPFCATTWPTSCPYGFCGSGTRGCERPECIAHATRPGVSPGDGHTGTETEDKS